jgi:hypothetical protein
MKYMGSFNYKGCGKNRARIIRRNVVPLYALQDGPPSSDEGCGTANGAWDRSKKLASHAG